MWLVAKTTNLKFDPKIEIRQMDAQLWNWKFTLTSLLNVKITMNANACSFLFFGRIEKQYSLGIAITNKF